jgi:G3E family GTPase
VSLVFDRPFDRSRLDAGLRALLAAQGDDVFRMKGIFDIADENQRYVVQAVHRLFDLHPADPWAAGPRESKLVFIGRNLDRQRLKVLLDLCLSRQHADVVV